MLHTPEEFHKLFTAIQADKYASEERKVTVFVSTLEADSVCALRILQAVLETSGQHYSVIPVASYEEIRQAFDQQLNQDEELKNVVLINCGGTIDLLGLLEPQSGTRLIVVDSHRPIHHNLINSLDDHAVVICEDDDLHPQTELPAADGASEDEQEDEEEARPTSRRRSDSGSVDGLSRGGEARRQRRKRLRQCRKDYYSLGAFWGRPATLTMLKFAQTQKQEDLRFFWWAAVALADQLVHHRLAAERYAEYAAELETETLSAGFADGDRKIQRPVEGGDGEVTEVARPGMWLTTTKEYKFPLLQHWNLYDAMIHSTHVAVRLQTWADKGRRKVEELLAKMGFRNKDCQVPYPEMKPMIHQKLHSKLETYAHTTGLSDLEYKGIRLEWGYSKSLTATDAVLAITALLESHATRPSAKLTVKTAFWKAWDALTPGDMRKIAPGLDLAKRLQQAILSSVDLILAGRAIHSTCAQFCYIDLTRTDAGNTTLLSQPMALLKLGIFLRDQRAWKQGKKAVQGVIIFGPPDADSRCYVVSVAKPPSVSNAEGDTFNLVFPKAARAAGVDLPPRFYEGFNACVNQIPAKDTQRVAHELALQYW